MVIHTWKCLLSRLMLCDSHIMESPWASSPKTYKPMSSFVRPCSTPAPFTWLKFQSSRQGFGSEAGICSAGTMPFVFLEKRWDLAGSAPRHFPSPAKNVPPCSDSSSLTRRRVSLHRTHACTRDDVSWYDLMKHISHGLEMEGKFFWNVFNHWLLESRGYTLLILACVCPGKGSITHGKYLYSCQIILITGLSLSRAAKSGGKVQTKSENQRSASAVAFFIRFARKHRDDYDLLAFLSQHRNLWPQPCFRKLCYSKQVSWSQDPPISPWFIGNVAN